MPSGFQECYDGGEKTAGKSDAERLRTVRSLLKRIDEHVVKIESNPTAMDERRHWEKEICSFWRDVFDEIRKVGPKAKNKALDLIEEPLVNQWFRHFMKSTK
ncbi:MAG: hypothetical protein HY686_04450 [Chloroflexi bacterium]|nr:hypothetical protein [Chloroflexota bacterium]